VIIDSALLYRRRFGPVRKGGWRSAGGTSGYTQKAAITSMNEQVKRAGAEKLGVVVNQVPRSFGGFAGGYSGYAGYTEQYTYSEKG
jgi:hypothetical protein